MQFTIVEQLGDRQYMRSFSNKLTIIAVLVLLDHDGAHLDGSGQVLRIRHVLSRNPVVKFALLLYQNCQVHSTADQYCNHVYEHNDYNANDKLFLRQCHYCHLWPTCKLRKEYYY